jgi:hypothetical protein
MLMLMAHVHAALARPALPLARDVAADGEH